MTGEKMIVGESNTLTQSSVKSLDEFDTACSNSLGNALESSCSDLNIEKNVQPTLKTHLGLGLETKDLEASIGDEPSSVRRKRAAWLRYAIFSVYRRLFSLVFIGNLAAFICVMIRNQRLLDLVNASAANMLVVGLARHPLVVNALFLTFGAIPRSAPFFLRRRFAKIYCFGGVHSGCGVAAFVWYVGLVGLLTQQYISQRPNDTIQITPVTMVLSYLILVFLMSIIVLAYPSIRVKAHDYFELTHRFCGWAVVILFWPLLFLFSVQAAHSNQQSLGRFLVAFPTFWMIIITTLALLYPWMLLKRVPVRAETLSSHAIRLHFNHTRVNFGQGLTLAKHPLRDWHSFATFPDVPSLPGTSGTTDQNPSFSCLISKAGDWTSDTIGRPPTHIWKRAVPVHGFAYAMKVFSRVILVTTGSGIGPCLGFVGDPNRPAMRIICQTRAPLKTYGQSVIDLVTHLDPSPYIVDTSVMGRRIDMLPRVLELFKEFNAEAVCVISNPVMTKKLIFDCDARDIPAFGPIFDS